MFRKNSSFIEWLKYKGVFNNSLEPRGPLTEKEFNKMLKTYFKTKASKDREK